MNNTDMKQA